jgi:hypothetical protein
MQWRNQLHGNIAQYGQNNADAKFMSKYNDLQWSNKYKIGRKRRSRSAADIQEDKTRWLRMTESIKVTHLFKI